MTLNIRLRSPVSLPILSSFKEIGPHAFCVSRTAAEVVLVGTC